MAAPAGLDMESLRPWGMWVVPGRQSASDLQQKQSEADSAALSQGTDESLLYSLRCPD